MTFIDGFVTAILLGLYIGECFFQWKPVIYHKKPYGSRHATVFAITKYTLSLMAFLVPVLNVTQVAAIGLTLIGGIKEVVYMYFIVKVKKEGGYKI